MLNVARQQKKTQGRCCCVLKFMFRSLKTERSGRPRNAACLGRCITGCDEGSNPVEYSESLAPSFFFKAKLRTYDMRYTVWRMCSYAFCLFLRNHVAVGKGRKVKTTQKEQPTAQTSGVHNDQHRAVCTPHSGSEDSPSLYPQYISAPSVGCG